MLKFIPIFLCGIFGLPLGIIVSVLTSYSISLVTSLVVLLVVGVVEVEIVESVEEIGIVYKNREIVDFAMTSFIKHHLTHYLAQAPV